MAFSVGNYWLQRTISLKRHSRGCHYITDEIKKALPEIAQIKMGVLHLFIQHTSATITVNESWDPSVKTDMEMILNRLVPETLSYAHSCEGTDDMLSLLHHIAAQTGTGKDSMRSLMERCFLVSGDPQYVVVCEPGHAKHALLGGPNITIPISDGKLALGTWQGVWLCEHRNSASSRSVVATVQGCPYENK